MHMLFFELFISLMMMCSIGCFIYFIHSFPSTLSNRHHRYQKTGAISLALFYLIVCDLNDLNYVLCGAVMTFLLLYFFYGFSVKPISCHSLVIQPSLFDKHRVQLHLARLSLPLDKTVYADLLLVLNEVQLEGIRTVVLVSPLFSKQGHHRNDTFFRHLLAQRGITLSSKPIPYWRKLWSCCLLAYQKHINHTPSLVSLSLTHWHQYTLHLPLTDAHDYQNDNWGRECNTAKRR